MEIVADSLEAALRKVLGAPLPLRKLAARGAAPGLKPGDALLLVACLQQQSTDEDAIELATLAQATLHAPPAPLLNGALAGALDPRALDALARHVGDVAVRERVVAHPHVDDRTVHWLASVGNEALCERIAANEERLLRAPTIIEALYKNQQARLSTVDRTVELALRHGLELTGIPAFREVAQALAGELVFEPSDEPTPDDMAYAACAEVALDTDALGEDTHAHDEGSGEEHVKAQFTEQVLRFDQLTTSGRIRRAQLGKSSDRQLALRDASPLVRKAAAKSELLTESEVARITANRSTNEDVLRLLGSNREWTRRHQIKVNLVMNPRTPYDLAARFVPYLRDHELRSVAQSRDVPAAIGQQARHQLQRKGHQ